MVQIGSLISVAMVMGANRIVKGFGIPYPLGKPGLTKEEERGFRRMIVEKALQLLNKEVVDQEISLV